MCGKQRVGLEHHVDRPLIGRNAGHVLAVDEDAALGRRFEAGEHAQQRGLAAAGAAEQREEFALEDVERHIVDGDEVTELLGDVVDADERLGRRVFPGLAGIFDAHYASPKNSARQGSPGFSGVRMASLS